MKENNENLPLLNSHDINLNNNLLSEVTLVWSNICVETSSSSLFSKLTNSALSICKKNSKKQSRLLLNNLSGIARPGEILAIMGTSGVGKTTLMRILSGNYDNHIELTQGNVYLNGYITRETQRQKGRFIGYVEQQESFIETITIQEHILFQAMVQMPNKISDNERRLLVKNVINKLYLTKSMNTTINRLSGGERKRLALASALLLEPPVILIDEPTSGLDTYLAKSLINIMHSLAIEGNHTIITVIHQPTSAMFDLMDKIYVLVEGGRQAFFGTKDQAMDFFINQCKLTPSSLDGFIEQLAAPSDSLTTENINIQQSSANEYSKSDYFKSLELAIDNHIQINNESNFIKTFDKNDPSQFPRQLKWLLWRSFLSDLRNPVRTTFLLVRVIVPAILYGIIYYQLCSKNHFIQNVSAINLAVVSLTVNTSAYMILGTMTINNHMGIRENRRGIYGILAYYLSIVIHDLPTLFIYPFIANTFIYWMSGMDYTWTHYGSFVGITILASNMGAAFGQLFSSFSSSVESVISIGIPILQTLSIYSGFYFNLNQIPSVLNTISYISPYYYSYTTLSTLQWGTKDHQNMQQCDKNSYKTIDNTNLNKESSTSTNYFDLCHQILNHIGIRDLFQNLSLMIFIMFIIVFICHFIAFIIIWIRAHQTHITQFISKKFKKNNQYNSM